MEEAAHGNEVEHFPHIPAFDEPAPKSERLLVVQEAILLEHAEYAPVGNHSHSLVQEEVGHLSIRERTMFLFVAFVAPFSPSRAETGRKRGVPHYHTNGFFDEA